MMLQKLLGDSDLEVFQERDWDTSPVKFEGTTDLFKGLYGVACVEQTVTQRDARYPLFKMVMQGRVLNKTEFTTSRTIGGEPVADVADIPTVYSLWNAGATVILFALHVNEPKLIPIARALEKELGHPIQFNAYLTPANSYGFDVHYDLDDVFIVQVEGSKRWKVWGERVRPLPLAGKRPSSKDKPTEEPVVDTILQPGEVIYIPRGFYHGASTEDCNSLHLTIGVKTYRRIDAARFLFDKLLDDLADEEASLWRSSLPVSGGESDDVLFCNALDQVLEKVQSQWSVEEVSRRFAQSRAADSLGLFEASTAPDNVALSTQLIIPAWIAAHAEVVDGKLLVFYQGRKLELPCTVEPVIREILCKRRFKPSEMSGLSSESALMLSQHLLREGLIRLADENAA